MTVLRRWIRRLLIASAATAGSVVAAGAPALGGTGVGAGTAHLTHPDGSGVITSGTAKTRFALGLPDGARCRQDSTMGTVLYSFLVPKGTDIGALVYKGDFANTGYFLTDPTGEPLYGINVAKATAAIYNLPTFAWEGLLLTHVPLRGEGGLIDPTVSHPGVWEVGVACTLAGHVQDYWSLEVSFVAKGNADFIWSTAGVPTSHPAGIPGVPLVAVGAGAAAAGGAIAVVGARRSRRVAKLLQRRR